MKNSEAIEHLETILEHGAITATKDQFLAIRHAIEVLQRLEPKKEDRLDKMVDFTRRNP